MNFNEFLLRPEDEMDFMPIIPLNESDPDDTNGIEVPDEIALLPLRNTVLFPGVVLPITVGRDKSIKAVHDAYKGDKLIGVIAQKDSSGIYKTTEDFQQRKLSYAINCKTEKHKINPNVLNT